MNKALRLIQYLYGEEDRPEEMEQLLADDDALRDEYRRLRAVKNQLDAKPSQRPDAAVIDRVVESAMAGAKAGARDVQASRAAQRAAQGRTDRAPSAPHRTPWQRVLRVTAALAVVLIGISVGVWQWEAEETRPANGGDAATVSTQDDAARMRAADDGSIPQWDEADDVVRLHRYIETLQARSSTTSWDYPGDGLQPASQVRSSNN